MVESGQPVMFVASHDLLGYAILNGMQIVGKGPADPGGNGLPDAWEILYFGGTNLTTAAADPDSDYLSNLREYQLGLNPMLASSMFDGINDSDRSEIVWSDDQSPPRAYEGSYNEGFNWTNSWWDGDGWGGSTIYPYSGSMMHVTDLVSGDEHGHWFNSGAVNIRCNTGDVLIVYINIDSSYPPDEVMLSWYGVGGSDADGEHRAYWGANLLAYGVDGTASRFHVGDLPTTGQWVRLEVPASAVGLEGKVVTGMAFNLFGGRAAFDRAGKFIPDLDANGLLDTWERSYFGHIGVDPNADPDGDGLSNRQEYILHTNPTKAATTTGGSTINLQIYTPLGKP
jgi:hypothetical protein